MQDEFRVYGRDGEPCPRCGTPIEKTRVAGRGTHYCPGLPAVTIQLPDGVLSGHWTDREAWTGCTVVLFAGRERRRRARCAAARRGRWERTRSRRRARASARTRFSSRVVARSGWLRQTASSAGLPSGAAGTRCRLGLCRSSRAPSSTTSPSAARRRGRPRMRDMPRVRQRCQSPERGSIGAGTGCTVGKLLLEGRTKGGLGIASLELGEGGVIAAIAVVNAVRRSARRRRLGARRHLAGRRVRAVLGCAA